MGKTSTTKRKHQPKKEETEIFDDDSDFETPKKPVKKAPKKQKKDTSKSESSKKKKSSKKAKKEGKEEEEVDTTPLVIKKDTIMNRALVKIGAHTSIQGGLHEAAIQAKSVGCRSFGLFVGSQRSWTQKTLTEDAIKTFKETCEKLGYPPHLILPHASYLINLGSPTQEKLTKSREAFVAEMQRCEQLGLVLYNFHPGSHMKEVDEDTCLNTIAESINYGHKHTKNIIAVLENTAGQGSNVGYKFEHLKKIIEKVDNKDRVGVCLDTCHAFGAGYDLRTKEKCDEVFKQFDEIVGFKYLKGMHLNDSKKGLNSKLDRHCNIGKGEIGLECFRYILNDKRFNNIPLVLETEGPWDKEIKLLESLID